MGMLISNKLIYIYIYKLRHALSVTEVGRVAENCTQVKSTSTYINYYSSKSKINNPNSYLSKSKKVSNEKSIQVASY